VRRSTVEIIGSLQKDAHMAFFKTACQDRHSRVRVAALKALGDFKRRNLAGFFKKRFEKDDSYLAQAEALRALGKCGDRSVIAFLQRAAKMKSPRHVIQTAAQSALGEIEKK
jgi:aminopeptidase N